MHGWGGGEAASKSLRKRACDIHSLSHTHIVQGQAARRPRNEPHEPHDGGQAIGLEEGGGLVGHGLSARVMRVRGELQHVGQRLRAHHGDDGNAARGKGHPALQQRLALCEGKGVALASGAIHKGGADALRD